MGNRWRQAILPNLYALFLYFGGRTAESVKDQQKTPLSGSLAGSGTTCALTLNSLV